MTRRPPKEGEMVVSVPGKDPTVDECSCGRYKVSDVSDLPNAPQITTDGIKHFFDEQPCRPSTREEWAKSSTYPYPFEEAPTGLE